MYFINYCHINLPPEWTELCPYVSGPLSEWIKFPSATQFEHDNFLLVHRQRGHLSNATKMAPDSSREVEETLKTSGAELLPVLMVAAIFTMTSDLFWWKKQGLGFFLTNKIPNTSTILTIWNEIFTDSWTNFTFQDKRILRKYNTISKYNSLSSTLFCVWSLESWDVLMAIWMRSQLTTRKFTQRLRKLIL